MGRIKRKVKVSSEKYSNLIKVWINNMEYGYIVLECGG